MRTLAAVKKMKRRVKTTELKLISELMKNSRRSDRQLAKAVGVSQPTVTRMRMRLEREGYIREYTVIPDFSKLGYHILGMTFLKLKKALSPKDAEKARETARQSIADDKFGMLMAERGLGLGYDGVFISLYRSYSDYSRHMDAIKQYPFVELSSSDSFLINMDGNIRYLPFTLKKYASLLLNTEDEKSRMK
jgi:DNA-binding Lrp family transcriptional regulator